MNNAFRDKSEDHKSKHYWFRYLLGQGLNNHNLISLSPYPREISQATMMAGSSRWQSAVIGDNGAWRARMRTMNPKSNRTCLYRRSDRGPVLTRVWLILIRTNTFKWLLLRSFVQQESLLLRRYCRNLDMHEQFHKLCSMVSDHSSMLSLAKPQLKFYGYGWKITCECFM